MVQARDVKARTPIHPRPREDESKHYILPMREPDVIFAPCPPVIDPKYEKNIFIELPFNI
jgi:hypothetical protein